MTVHKVDFESFDSLKDAFSGQDAVVSVVGSPGVSAQRLAIDAAIAAGVKRFIPSEFGVNTRKVRDRPMGAILRGKVEVVDYLIEREREIEWTGVSTGLFFDWVSFSTQHHSTSCGKGMLILGRVWRSTA